MAYHTRPEGLKSNGKPKSLQVTDDGYLKIDMQDTTVVAEFTPGSNVTLLDSAGTNEATIDSSGALKTIEKTPLTQIKLLDTNGTNKASINSAGALKTREEKLIAFTPIIDDATFTTTVTGEDIDFSTYRHGIITVAVGVVTAGTISVKLQCKDSNGNYIDYLTLSTLSVSSTNTFEEFYDLPFNTGRIVATSAAGNIANVTVEVQMTP